MASSSDATRPSRVARAAGGAEGEGLTVPSRTEPPFTVLRASNELLFGADGRQYVDLLCGYGTVFLGHGHPAIVARVEEQLHRIWAAGRLPTAETAEATDLVETFFPRTHRLASLYSTGMEAAEFALRVARVATGRRGFLGLDRSMHGKSQATAFLGWHNDLVNLPDFERIPFLPSPSEEESLGLLAAKLSDRSVAALFVEPVHGSGAGRSATPAFYRQVAKLCAEHGTLCVFDEILTGFYRTGETFCFETYGVVPDIVLIGKVMGNGFPVSGVVVSEGLPTDGRVFPGSTFSGNPLACAVVAATLSQIRRLDMPARVARIEQIVEEELHRVAQLGIALRGRGALWFLEFPEAASLADLVEDVRERGVVVASAGSCIRLLPSATISPERLSASCAAIREACVEASDSWRGTST